MGACLLCYVMLAVTWIAVKSYNKIAVQLLILFVATYFPSFVCEKLTAKDGRHRLHASLPLRPIHIGGKRLLFAFIIWLIVLAVFILGRESVRIIHSIGLFSSRGRNRWQAHPYISFLR